jgi:hypothetical protein
MVFWHWFHRKRADLSLNAKNALILFFDPAGPRNVVCRRCIVPVAITPSFATLCAKSLIVARRVKPSVSKNRTRADISCEYKRCDNKHGNTSSHPLFVKIFDRMGLVIRAIDFAAIKHANQRGKNAAKTPYINHPIEVVRILSEAGITDENVLGKSSNVHVTNSHT